MILLHTEQQNNDDNNELSILTKSKKQRNDNEHNGYFDDDDGSDSNLDDVYDSQSILSIDSLIAEQFHTCHLLKFIYSANLGANN